MSQRCVRLSPVFTYSLREGRLENAVKQITQIVNMYTRLTNNKTVQNKRNILRASSVLSPIQTVGWIVDE